MSAPGPCTDSPKSLLRSRLALGHEDAARSPVAAHAGHAPARCRGAESVSRRVRARRG